MQRINKNKDKRNLHSKKKNRPNKSHNNSAHKKIQLNIFWKWWRKGHSGHKNISYLGLHQIRLQSILRFRSSTPTTIMILIKHAHKQKQTNQNAPYWRMPITSHNCAMNHFIFYLLLRNAQYCLRETWWIHHNKQDTSLLRKKSKKKTPMIINKWEEGSFGQQRSRQGKGERKRDRKQIIWNTTPRINYTQLCVFS